MIGLDPQHHNETKMSPMSEKGSAHTQAIVYTRTKEEDLKNMTSFLFVLFFICGNIKTKLERVTWTRVWLR